MVSYTNAVLSPPVQIIHMKEAVLPEHGAERWEYREAELRAQNMMQCIFLNTQNRNNNADVKKSTYP